MSKEHKENPGRKTLTERVTILETNYGWIKKILEKIDRRTWWTLGSVVALGIIAILAALAGRVPL
ncbi:hypothetical protein ES703_104904 [subsurface metagenome]